jgi:hypothetical protein
MAGAGRKHGLALAMGFAAGRKGCQLFIADMNVRIEPGVAGPFGWRHEAIVDGAFRLACLDADVAVADAFADLRA